MSSPWTAPLLLCSLLVPVLGAQTDRTPAASSTAPSSAAPQNGGRTALPGQPAQATVTGERAAGRVVSTRDGHGIPHAMVTLSPVVTGTAREPASSALTDNDGRFRFDALPAGKYHLQASATGYTPSAYQEHGTFSTAIVLGRGYPIDRLELKLTPTALLHGRILDNNGDPVQRAQISLYRERTAVDQADTAERILRVRDVQTEDDGTYEISNLRPGKFYLAVTAMPWYAVHPRSEAANVGQFFRQNIDPALDVAYPTIYYPHALSDKEATPIDLHEGEQATANLLLQPVHAVSLTLQAPPPEPNQPQFPPQLMHRVFNGTQFANAQVERDNEGWHVSGIAPGEYTLQQMRQGNRMQSPGQPITIGASSLAVPLPAEPENARLIVTPHLLSGGSLPANLRINLRSIGREGVLSQVVNEKGEKPTAEFADIPAGEYRLEAYTPNGRLLNISALTLAGQPIADRRVHLTGGGEVAIDLTLQAGSHVLNGVAARDGKAAGGAMVILVPAGADTGSALFRRDQSDMDGTFTLNNVVPGNYLLLAIDDAWQMRWTDLPALTPYLNRAVPVSVADTGSGSGSGKIEITEAVQIQPR